MSEQQFPERPLDIWQVATLRLTAFPSPGFQLAHPTWWTDLLADQPETTVAQPKRGRHQEEGPLANGKLILRLEPLRIDWMFTLSDDQKGEVEGISTLGPFSEALDTFLPLMDSWFKLETRPPIHRLAFGAILQQPIQTVRF